MSDPDLPSPAGDTGGPDAATAGGGERRRRGLLGSVVNRVAPTVINRVAPTVIDNVDLDRVLEAIDLNQVAERLDLDALIDRLDVDAVAARLDLDALIDRLDVDAVAARLDLDALIDRLDVDAVAARLDLNALVERIDMAQVTAGASQDLALSGLDLARRQVIRADATVESFVDHTVRRRAGRRPAAPPWLAEAAPVDVDATATGAFPEEARGSAPATAPVDVDATATGAPPDEPAGRAPATAAPPATAASPAPDGGPPQSRSVSGHYAGAVSRLLAVALDLAGSFAVYGFLASAVEFVLGAFTPVDITGTPGPVAGALATAWLVLWLAVPVALFGRTPAMAVVGLAVVTHTGTPLGWGRALVRAVVEPISVVFLVVGFAGTVLGRERRALHDLAAGTIVVYDWGVREAKRPVTVREYLSARVRRVDAGDAPTAPAGG